MVWEVPKRKNILIITTNREAIKLNIQLLKSRKNMEPEII